MTRVAWLGAAVAVVLVVVLATLPGGRGESMVQRVVGMMYRTVIQPPEPPVLLQVAALAAAPSEWEGQRVRLLGSASEITHDAGTVRFVLMGDGAVVPVSYAGRVPSTFEEGSMVMVDGAIRDSQLVGDTVLVRAAM